MEDEDCFDSSTLEILDKMRKRQQQMKQQHENENAKPDDHEKENQKVVVSEEKESETPAKEAWNPAAGDVESPAASSTPTMPIQMKSRLAELSHNVDDFEFEHRRSPKKEAYLHGPQKRVSVGGETRADVLFCPGSSMDKVKKEVTFAHPMTYNAFNDESCCQSGSDFRSSGSDANETHHGPLESTCIDGSTGSRQYAQVHFSSKSSTHTESVTSMKISPIASDKPLYGGEPSPIVHQVPIDRDDDDDEVFDDKTIEKSEVTLVETANSASKAKSIVQQYEERQRQVASSSTGPTLRKPTKFPTTPMTPRLPPGLPMAPRPVDHNPNVEEKPVGSVKSLLSRWEVSSATGKLLHPDMSAQDLLPDAVNMARPVKTRTWKPKTPSQIDGEDNDELLQTAEVIARTVNRPPKFQAPAKQAFPSQASLYPTLDAPSNDVSVVVASGIPPTKHAELDGAEDPISKSPRLDISHTSVHDSSSAASQPECVLEEDDLIEDVDSDSETETALLPKELDEDSYIDKAFDFIDGSGYKSSRTAPLAEPEAFNTPKPLCSQQQDDESLLEAINTEVGKLATPAKSASDASTSSQVTPSLAHSISFYRKRRAEVVRHTPTLTVGNAPKASLEPLHEREPSPERRELDRGRLHEMLKDYDARIAVEEEHIKQATRAFAHCRETPEFRGSREEVDAQRALLISQERRKTLIAARERLQRDPSEKRSNGPLGSVTITEMSFRLTRDFVNAHINASNDGMLFYFIVLIKHGDVVEHTSMVTSDDALRTGHGLINFSHYLHIKELRPDFKIRVEVHGLKTQRELISHQEKYRSRKGSQSKGTSKHFSKSFGASHSSSISGFITSPGAPPSVIDAAFQKLGEMHLDINLVKQQKFALGDAHYPLDGSATIRSSVRPMQADHANRAAAHRGFVSLYETIQGMGSWNRLWCSISDGKLRFWRYPEDEDNKETYCEFDMCWCINEVVPTPEDVKSFQHSMQMDMAVPTNQNSTPQKIRVLLAADTKESMAAWVNAFNKSIRNLLLWTTTATR